MLSLAFCAVLLDIYALCMYLPLLTLLSLGGLALASLKYKQPFCATARREGLYLLTLPLRSMLAITSE